MLQTRFRKLLLLLMMSLWGGVVLSLPQKASAVTPLTKAVIEEIKNLVQLVPQNKPKRQARKLDAMIPGDGLSTGRASLAELRFNDGSIARIGQQAVFRFLPKTRKLRLSDGTVLLLIRPGQGETRVNTPNAAAAIRGSALFVRYNPQTETTIVGALTDSGIQVHNKNASQKQNLAAGQLIVVVKDRFQGLYEFDLRTFYETSNLVRGLDLTLKSGTPNSDPALASIQAETAAAVATQQPLTGQGVLQNLSALTTFSKDTSIYHMNMSVREAAALQHRMVAPPPPAYRIHNNAIDRSPVENLLNTGQVLLNSGEGNKSTFGTQPSNNNPGNGNSSNGNPGNDKPVGNVGNDNPGNDKPVGNVGNDNPGNGNSGNANPVNSNQGNNNTGNGNSGNSNPGNEKQANNNSGNDNPGNTNPGNGNPGNNNSDNGNSGNGNPGNDKPVGNAGENPGNGNQNYNNPGNGNPGNNNSDNGNPGNGNPGNDKPVGNAGENPGNVNQNNTTSREN
jgi:hypothetical protein